MNIIQYQPHRKSSDLTKNRHTKNTKPNPENNQKFPI